MSAVTVKTVSVDNHSVLLDCTECGPMGVWPPSEVQEVAYSHLEQVHNCDMDNVSIEPLDPNGENQ